MNHRGPTLVLLIDLCARLRLACEAVGAYADRVEPTDVRLEDLSAAEHARLVRLGQQDLWALINAADPAPRLNANPAA
jgi:tRNA A37 threonylcarbamoyladenosine dehydratase